MRESGVPSTCSYGTIRVMSKLIAIGILTLGLGCKGGGGAPPADTSSPGTAEPKMCTQEAKVCPDGSAVGRTGPDCEFAPCPEPPMPIPPG